MAGAELEVEAWAPVPQGRGYECKDAGSLPLWNSLGNVATAGMLAAPEAEGAAEAVQTGLRERPTHLRQVQKQVLRGFHHRARPADFTLRLLWREIQEKV